MKFPLTERPFPQLTGIAAGTIFTAAWFAEGLYRANYDPWRHAISSLALGQSGWQQVATFMLTGALVVLFSNTVRERLLAAKKPVGAAHALTVVGIGFIGAGLFPTGPVNGYPVGDTQTFSVHDLLHRLFSLGVFLGFPVAMVLLDRSHEERAGRLHKFSRCLLVAFVSALLMAGLGFKGVAFFSPIAGAMQRPALTVAFAWITWITFLFWPMAPRGPTDAN